MSTNRIERGDLTKCIAFHRPPHSEMGYTLSSGDVVQYVADADGVMEVHEEVGRSYADKSQPGAWPILYERGDSGEESDEVRTTSRSAEDGDVDPNHPDVLRAKAALEITVPDEEIPLPTPEELGLRVCKEPQPEPEPEPQPVVDALSSQTYRELQSMARDLGISAGGVRDDLEQRIRLHLAADAQ